jgi:hypothetical protein
VRPFSRATLQGGLLVLLASIGLGWNALLGTNALAYYKNSKLRTIFITLAPGVNAIKLFSLVIY